LSLFEKRGYSAEGESVDMTLELRDFSIDKVMIPECPENVIFRYTRDTDRNQLLSAVSMIDPDWVRYYEQTDDPVLVAEEQGTGRSLDHQQERRSILPGRVTDCR
jgi:hypothetical protein